MKGKRESPTGWDWCFTELRDRYKCWEKLPEGDAPILTQSDQVQMLHRGALLLASMCRGYLHAKSLGEGGEFLSYVWLLSNVWLLISLSM